VSEFANISI
jgi:hypothetical protein